MIQEPVDRDERREFWVSLARLHRARKNPETPHIGLWDLFCEEDFAVQAAKIQCYGIEKLVAEGRPQVLDREAGYELLAIPLPPMDRWSSNPIVILKMRCTTTKHTHYSPVEPRLTTVRDSLDWYFQTTNYLDSVGHQA